MQRAQPISTADRAGDRVAMGEASSERRERQYWVDLCREQRVSAPTPQPAFASRRFTEETSGRHLVGDESIEHLMGQLADGAMVARHRRVLGERAEDPREPHAVCDSAWQTRLQQRPQ